MCCYENKKNNLTYILINRETGLNGRRYSHQILYEWKLRQDAKNKNEFTVAIDRKLDSWSSPFIEYLIEFLEKYLLQPEKCYYDYRNDQRNQRNNFITNNSEEYN